MAKKNAVIFLSLFLQIYAFCIQYQISDFSFCNDGITKEEYFFSEYPLDTKTVFSSQDELNEFLEEYKDEIQLKRLFSILQIEYEEIEKDDDVTYSEIKKIKVNIYTKDSSHRIFLPYFNVNSNNGDGINAVTLKFKTSDNNFLGRMKTFSSESFYEIGKKNIETQLDFFIPFNFQNLHFLFETDYSLSYKFKEKFSPLYQSPFFEWNGLNALTLELPFDYVSFIFTIQNSFKNDFKYFEDGNNMFITDGFCFSVPMKIYKLQNKSFLFYEPSLSSSFNWNPFSFNHNNETQYSDSGIAVSSELYQIPFTFEHSLHNQKIKWSGNWKKGYSFSLGNENTYILNTAYAAEKTHAGDFYNTIFFDASFYQPFVISPNYKIFDEAAVYFRFQFFHYFNEYKKGGRININKSPHMYGKEIGKELRGILDKTEIGINGTSEVSSAVIANINFPFHIFQTDFKTEAINFDLQMSPFFDIAFTDFSQWNFTSGLEFFIFPKKWSSYTIRASFGVDLKKAFSESSIIYGIWKNKEIFLGMGFLF